jgi:prophage antirepressor-like protein
MENTQELRAFENSKFGELEVTLIEGKVYFPATRCAEILGYTNPRKAIGDHCRYVTKRYVPHPQNLEKVIEMSFIPEGDLYRLIARSNLPAAEQFERWVFDEVLPEIRKTGGYMIASSDEADEDIMARAMIIAQRTIERRNERIAKLESTVSSQHQQITEMMPKASYYDVILNTKDTISVTKIAKDYGKSAVWLNEYLHNKGVQFKQGDIWLLYAKYAGKGYTCTKTHSHPASNGEIHSKIHTYWTQKGRLFLYELLKKDGVLPLIEQERPAA